MELINLEYNNPEDYHSYNINIDNNHYDKRKCNNISNENSKEFWEKYFSHKNYKANKEDIKIYDEIIPIGYLNNINIFIKRYEWLYGYKNCVDTTILNYIKDDKEINDDIDILGEDILKNNDDIDILGQDILKINEIQCFYGNVIKNTYFTSLFFKIILPNIDIINKENIQIDRAFMVGRLHNLSEFYHKDERSTINYGPSVYVFLNNNWKTYYDGSLSFMLDINKLDTHNIQNKFGRIVVFPPNIYHKTCELSAYSLFDNAMSTILEFHLVYNK